MGNPRENLRDKPALFEKVRCTGKEKAMLVGVNMAKGLPQTI